ncbi:MAG: cyclic nucleotide-binding domain-containing protein, partial [Xanthomonadales bacterium]|nr:cyclic nucleotide-binding domain-containing protein [Xanthomonadales bacterium]
MDHTTLAFLFGGLSAASLPIGAAAGIWLNPSLRLTAAVMAFGAGALLCALALELVVPALAHFPDDPFQSFKWMAIGSMIGCLLFIGLDRALSNMGGYLRKHSTIAHRLKHSKKKQFRKILDKLSVLDLMLALPPDEIRRVVGDIEKRVFKAGELICHEEDPCDALFLIESGSVRICPHDSGGHEGQVSILTKGEAFGEMALVTSMPAIRRAEAVEDTVLWEVHKDDFNEVVAVSPGLQHTLGRWAAHHRGENNRDIQRHQSESWLAAASHNLESELGKPTEAEIISAASAQKGGGSNVALAIWLGILLDGIPESLVIGGSMEGASISIALIGGLFIANFPESMSSASVMKKQGSSTFNIMAMWVSLMVMTAVGAALGHLFI